MRRVLISLFSVSALLLASDVGAESAPEAPDAAQAKACYACHPEAKIKKDAFVHGPVSLGLCELCHTPHRGERKSLLTAKGSDLCLSCHDAKHYRGKIEHAPVRDGCLGCHSAHGGRTYSLLVATSADQTCQKCHGNRLKKVATVGGNCTTCHDPHRSSRAKLLKTSTPKGTCQRDGQATAALGTQAR